MRTCRPSQAGRLACTMPLAETTRLDDHTRSRLDRLIIELEQDLNEDEFERLSQRLTG